jgi:hypothetical protein
MNHGGLAAVVVQMWTMVGYWGFEVVIYPPQAAVQPSSGGPSWIWLRAALRASPRLGIPRGGLTERILPITFAQSTRIASVSSGIGWRRAIESQLI